MRLNRSTLLSIMAMLLFGLVLTQAESFLGDYQIYIAKLIFINAILALSLNLIYGFTGLFSLGHAGFIAIGAYVSALCILSPEQKEMMWILEPIIWPFSDLLTPFWVSVLAGGLVATIFAFIIAVPVLRLGDDYLGIATLGFAEIIRVIIVNATAVTNGSLGIKGIPGHASLISCYGWMLFTLIVLSRLVFSNYGNVLRCIRDNEIAARVMRRIFLFIPLLLALLAGAAQAAPGGERILTRLPNGLTVYIIKDSRFPLVATRLYVRTGSANEDAKQAGISHLLEHMVFKGTDHRPKGQVARDVEALGGYLNAATSFDKTWFMTDMPAAHWRMGMDVVKEMAFQASLDPKELESEKKVVISELERDQDSPMRAWAVLRPEEW
jgi:Predicted Zn-dependent peptidases